MSGAQIPSAPQSGVRALEPSCLDAQLCEVAELLRHDIDGLFASVQALEGEWPGGETPEVRALVKRAQEHFIETMRTLSSLRAMGRDVTESLQDRAGAP